MDDLDFGTTIKGFSPGQKVLNRYTLERILGRGGMGVVWLARDDELDIAIALKFLPEIVALDKESVTELKRETRRNLALTHPHIVRVFDFVQGPMTAAISMEYVDGASLSALKVDQPGQVFPLEQLRPWIEQLCDALAYAHGTAQVVHRDIKPANLMINARGQLKVTDFGIARSVADSVSRVSAQAGGSSGTPVYMSPQQMMGEDPAVTDDIYAVGATLYELLTGKPPFHSGNIMMQVQSKVAPPLNERRKALGIDAPPVPEVMESTIAACLAKEPAARPSGAAELAKALFAPGTTPRSASIAPVPGEPKPKTARYAVLTAGALSLAAAGWYFGVHQPEQQRQVEAAATAERNRQAEEAKRAETARLAEEARQQEALRQEQARVAEENRKADAARIAEESRKAEEARQAEVARQAEAARQAEETRKQEAGRKNTAESAPANTLDPALRAARDRVKAGAAFNYGLGASALIDAKTKSIYGVPWVLHAAAGLQADERSLIARAGTTKFAVVDLAKIYDNDPRENQFLESTRAAEARAQEQVARLNADGQKLIDDYKLLRDQSGNPALTNSARTKAETDAQTLLGRIQQKQAEVQAFIEQTRKDMQQRVAQNRDTLLASIVRELGARFGDKVDLLVDKSGPGLAGNPPVLYADPAYDVTDEYMAGHNGGGGGPPLKVVTVDLGRLYAGHYKVVEAEAKLGADKQQAQQQVDALNKEGQTMVDDYKQLTEQAGNPALTAATRAAAEGQAKALLVRIQDKQKEVEQFRTTIQRTLEQRRHALRDLVIEELTQLVTDQAKRRGATLVLDVSATGMEKATFAEAGPQAFDLTDDARREVEKYAPAR